MNALSPHMPIAFEPSPDNTRLLRDAFGRFATGVTVVTAASDDGPVGITANSFSSVSLDPALVLWSPAKTSSRFNYFQGATHFAIHVLAADQIDLCNGFAKDAFALQNVDHSLNAEGVPVIANCLARFECKQSAVHEGGDHVIIVGEVLRGEMKDGDALAFYGGKFGEFTQP